MITRYLSIAVALVATAACDFSASADTVFVRAVYANGNYTVVYQQYENKACGDKERAGYDDCYDFIVSRALDAGYQYEFANDIASAVLSDCTPSTEKNTTIVCSYDVLPTDDY